MLSQTVLVALGLNPSHRTLQEIRNGNNPAFQQLLHRWEALIRAKARSFFAPGCGLADFQQVGRLALYRAAINYCPGATQFSTYATTLIVRAMIDEQRNHEDEMMPGDSEVAIAETIEYADSMVCRELTTAISRWRNTLGCREQKVITMLFYMEMKQVAVADRLGISPARVNQIVRKIRLAAQCYRLN